MLSLLTLFATTSLFCTQCKICVHCELTFLQQFRCKMLLTCLTTLIQTEWSPRNSRRSCILLFSSLVLFLLSLLGIGYTYLHVNIPSYNERRLSKYPLVCLTVENDWVGKEHCELPWDKDHITIATGRRLLYENDAHSATIYVTKVPVKRGDDEGDDNRTNVVAPLLLREVTTERHFTWSSCGEFCAPELVDTFGCRQIRVNVRREGSPLQFVGCEGIEVMECPFLQDDPTLKGSDDNDCSTSDEGFPSCLRLGIFKCREVDGGIRVSRSVGVTNSNDSAESELDNNATFITHLFYNHSNSWPDSASTSTSTPKSTTTPPLVNSSHLSSPILCTHIEKLISCNLSTLSDQNNYHDHHYNCTHSNSPSCFKTPGTYVCNSESICRKIPRPESVCSRICEGIGLQDKNVVVADQNFDKILTAKCTMAYRNDKKTRRIEVWPSGITHKTDAKWKTTPQLLVTCNKVDWNTFLKHSNNTTRVKDNGTDFFVRDCFNGTRLENTTLPPSLNLRTLQSLWNDNLATADYHLDPIDMMDAPPSWDLIVQTSAPLYLGDYYKNMGDGCSSPEGNNNNDKCTSFYDKYGKLPPDLRGPSIFPCYCRSILPSGSGSNKDRNGTFCVVGDEGSTSVFEMYWEDGLVHFLEAFYIPIMTLLVILLLISVGMVGVLLYPLLLEEVEVGGNNMIVSDDSSSREMISMKRSGSGKSVTFVEDKRSSIFTVSGGGGVGEGDDNNEYENSMQREVRRSRSNSIVSVM